MGFLKDEELSEDGGSGIRMPPLREKRKLDKRFF